ncbi:PH (Pleckstrin Homology) domain-containing protein [Micromonospora kangleipakensis]|uniref:PH (Pleckstrin Homology) domain-containing protein n=1 Tax=Micromonospora kangleipakensis TaxID=1077942 RepID=A0A4Q8B435_9ACTN|nr:PH domain-containing protein [Micromonospora kangleipakensis]RZU72277.1 PH (Pleckstrin Homology) domain-containing protein [Micromonospora kangleipakensis]
MQSQSSPVHQWRVPVILPVAKLIGAVVVVGLGLLLAGDDRVQPVLAGLAAAALAGWGLRDLVAPVRLAADRDGITVAQGFAGHRRLPWREVEAITVDRRTRRGLTAETLEIDAGESLHLFGRYDLNAPPAEVAETLRAAQAAAR